MSSTTSALWISRGVQTCVQGFSWVGAPAVKEDTYEINTPLIVARIFNGLILSTVATVAVSYLYPPIILLMATHATLIAIASIASIALTVWSEVWRANRALDRRAVEQFHSEKPLSIPTMDFLSSRKAAVEYLLREKRRDNTINLDKEDIYNTTLVEYAGRAHLSFDIFKMLVDAGADCLASNGGDSVLQLFVENENLVYLEYILSKTPKEKIQALAFDCQLAIWKKVTTKKVVELLSSSGFSLNVKNVEGVTPLMILAKNDAPDLISAALNAGADPLLETKTLRKRASEYASEHSIARFLLEDAKTRAGAQQLHHKEITLLEKAPLSWLPWKPPVKKGKLSYEVDFIPLIGRIALLGLGTAAAFYFTPYFVSYSITPLIARIITGLFASCTALLPICDIWRAKKENDLRAVAEYLTLTIPSRQATARIVSSIHATRLLIEYDTNNPDRRILDKPNEKGQLLLTSCKEQHSEIFTALIDAGANFLKDSCLKSNGFLHAAQYKTPFCFNHIFEKNELIVLEPDQQIDMWCSVKNKEMAQVLKQKRFDPNITDKNGNTPLMYLALSQISKSRFVYYDQQKLQVEILLEIGANPTLKNNDGRTAFDLCNNGELDDILKQAEQNWKPPT